MRTYIFACVHNAGRSQISAALFNQLADPMQARAISAGTHPAAHVHPVVVEAMLELGIDLSRAEPRKLTSELAQHAEMLITMGCGDACPYIPSLRRADWPLPDPKGQNIAAVRSLQDDIRTRVLGLLDAEHIPILHPATTLRPRPSAPPAAPSATCSPGRPSDKTPSR